ncbi:MAG: TolC family protein [Cyanobacteriota bacterium]|nr:TolC family protein [Cyanobacteriota bacterium]
MIRQILALALLGNGTIVSTGVAMAQSQAMPAASHLSLNQVLQIGLPQSLRLERADRQVARDAALTNVNRALLLPRLDLIGSASYTQVGTSVGLLTNLPTLGDISLSLRQKGYAVLRNSFANAGVVLDVNLLPLQPLATLAASRAMQEGGLASRRESERQSRFELVSAYRQLQLHQALVPVWKTALQASSALEADVTAFRRRGLAARIDTLRAQALKEADRRGLAEVEAQLLAQRQRLLTLLQRPSDAELVASDPIAPQAAWPLDLASTVERALAGRPLLEALQWQQQAQRQQARAARAGNLPSVMLIAGIGYSGNRLEAPVLQANGSVAGAGTLPLPKLEQSASASGSFYNWGAAVLVRQPLWDGGRSNDAAALADREADLLLADERLARQQIRLDVSSAWSALQAAPQAIAAARDGVAAQEQALRDARLRYRAQVDPLTDVLLVQRDLQAARAALLMVLTRQALDHAVLERETGGAGAMAAEASICSDRSC